MSLFWQTVTTSLISGIFSSAIVGTIFQHYLSKKLDRDSRQRIEAAKVAEFFAKWIKYNGKETSFLKKEELYNYYEDLTKMSYELSLWIKDETLLIEILKRCTNLENALSTKELIIKVRELILNKKTKKLTANNLVHWSVKDN